MKPIAKINLDFKTNSPFCKVERFVIRYKNYICLIVEFYFIVIAVRY